MPLKWCFLFYIMFASLYGQITLHIYSLNNYVPETCGIRNIVFQSFDKNTKNDGNTFSTSSNTLSVSNKSLSTSNEISKYIVEYILAYDYLFTPPSALLNMI